MKKSWLYTARIWIFVLLAGPVFLLTFLYFLGFTLNLDDPQETFLRMLLIPFLASIPLFLIFHRTVLYFLSTADPNRVVKFKSMVVIGLLLLIPAAVLYFGVGISIGEFVLLIGMYWVPALLAIAFFKLPERKVVETRETNILDDEKY